MTSRRGKPVFVAVVGVGDWAPPLSDGLQGIQVIRLLAAAQQSLDGAPVAVKG